MLRLLERLPGAIDLGNLLALARHECALIVGAHSRLKREEQKLHLILLAEAWRLLLDAIIVKLGELPLHAGQRVFELAPLQLGDAQLDPLEEVGGDRLVLVHHLLVPHQLVHDVADAAALDLLGFEPIERVVKADNIRDQRTLVGQLNVHV